MAQSAHNRYALGVDIGGSHVCSAVVDLATGQLCGEPHTDKVDAAAGARPAGRRAFSPGRGGFFVFLYRKDCSRLTLQLTAQMSP